MPTACAVARDRERQATISMVRDEMTCARTDEGLSVLPVVTELTIAMHGISSLPRLPSSYFQIAMIVIIVSSKCYDCHYHISRLLFCDM